MINSSNNYFTIDSNNINSEIIFGVFGYSHSTNLGDYMQTIAQLNILSYFYRKEWNIKSPILRQTLEYLSRNKYFGDHHLFQSQPKNVRLVWIDRDLLSLYQCEQPIWIILNGWFMHHFDLDSSNPVMWPPSDCFRPIPVSFHCQNLSILDNENSILYFKKYSPIGCRDYSTVKIFKDNGIPAYYSGCLTSTLENPQPVSISDRVDKYIVDLPQQNITHIYKNNNFTCLEDKFDNYLTEAISIFTKYCYAKSVKTSRLHAYIPCKMLEVPKVYMVINNSNDSRFDGLLDSFKSKKYIFDSLLLKNKLLNILSNLINKDMPESFIYNYLQNQNTSYLSTYQEKPFYLTKNTNYIDLYKKNPQTIICSQSHKNIYNIEDCADIVSNTTNKQYYLRNFLLKSFNNTINILICFDTNYLDIAITMLKSLCISNPHLLLKIHCFTNNISIDDIDKIKAQVRFFNNIIIENYNINYKFKKYHNNLTHVSETTMYRLLTPQILSNKNINRVIYLDVDTLVIDKLDDLLTIDTGETGIAARNSLQKNVVKNWIKNHPYSDNDIEYKFEDGFNAGVLVLDLNKLRTNSFTNITKFYYEKYGFNDQIILNLYCQNKHNILPDKYNIFISPDINLIKTDNNTILHFVSSKKPWNYDQHKYADQWKYYKNNLWIKYNNLYNYQYTSKQEPDNLLPSTNTNILYVFITHKTILEKSIKNIAAMMNNQNNQNYIIAYGSNETFYLKNKQILSVEADDSYCGLPEKINKIFTYIKQNKYFDKYTHFVKLDHTAIIKNNLTNLYNIDYGGFLSNNLNINREYHFNRCKDSLWNKKEYSGRVVPYCWGGYGYILSKNAINKIFPNNNYVDHIYEDLYIGLCLHDKGIYPKNVNIQDFIFNEGHTAKNIIDKISLPLQ